MMSIFPEELIRIAATGSNPRTKETLEQSRFTLLDNWEHDNTPEWELLVSIAGYAFQRLAGYIPETRFDTLAPEAELSENPSCNTTAQQHLKLMLNNVHEELLPDWINEVHRHNQRVPDEMLPSILNYGKKRSVNHSLLRQALGERGRWLARQANKNDWEWVLQEETDEIISENHYAAWENYFRRMRQKDPVRALNILRQYWTEVDSLMQMALLRAMQEGLSDYDSDFLWGLFAEETTRFMAARCLFQIQGTEFAIKARENIGKLLSLIPLEYQGESVIDFTWSQSFEGHPLQISREKSHELCSIMGYDFNPELMLMLLPLSYWYETYDVTPDVLVLAAQNSTRPSVFYRIWTTMAIQTSDSDFLFALVMNVERHLASSIVAHLTQEQLMVASSHWLKEKPIFSLQHNAIILLNAIEVVWSEELADAFLDSLEACFKTIPRPMLDSNMREILKHYARLLPLSIDTRFEQVLQINARDELSDAEIEQINGIIDIIKFRSDMLKAIQAGTN